MTEEITEKPHRAVLFIQAEVHELLRGDTCAGDAVHVVDRFPIWLDGPNKTTAIDRLEALVSELKKRCD